MATVGPRKPFAVGGVVYPSQYAYKQHLAAQAGFGSPAARSKAIQAAKGDIARYTSGLPAEQVGVIAAGVADWRGKLGVFREGTPVGQRPSGRMPLGLYLQLKALGGDGYAIWKVLYQ